MYAYHTNHHAYRENKLGKEIAINLTLSFFQINTSPKFSGSIFHFPEGKWCLKQ